MLDSTDK